MRFADLQQFVGNCAMRIEFAGDARSTSGHRRLRTSAPKQPNRWATYGESLVIGSQIECAFQQSGCSPPEFAAWGGMKYVYLARLRNGQFPEITPLIREACYFWNQRLPEEFRIQIPEHLQGPGNKRCQ